MRKLALSWFFSFALLLGSIQPAPVQAATNCGEAYVCGEALIKFSRHLKKSEIQFLLHDWGLHIRRYFPRTRLYQVKLPAGQDTLSFVAALGAQDYVLLAEPNWVVHGNLLPDDSDFSLLWGLNNTGQTGGSTGTDIGMDAVWDELTDGSGPIVAVIDSGIDYTHPDLAANIWINPGEIPDNGLDDDDNGFIDDIHGYDFRNGDSDPMDDHEHGTHVSGIIGAVGNNALGVTGVSWSARLMALKFLNQAASGNVADAIACIEYALANGATILNNSWGGGGFDNSLLTAILDSDAEGTIFVAAAGNQGRDTDNLPFYPACYDVPNVVSVAAHTHDNELWVFSNYGMETVDLAAPGSAIFSTKPGNTYGNISGTSMATAYFSGAAALLWTEFPQLSHRQIIHLLYQSATPEDYLSDVTLLGSRLNVAEALTIAQNPNNQAPMANAGPDQNHPLGTIVSLKGSATDADGDFPLIFEWELEVPAGSASQLSTSVSKDVSFVPDQEGTYTLRLYVSDSLSTSLPDTSTVTISGGSLPPPNVVLYALSRDSVTGSLLDLSTGIPIGIGQEVFLDGGDSTSLFPENLLFNWEWVSRPRESQALLANPGQSLSGFIPDLPGTYVVRLNVEDGYGENHADISILVEGEDPPKPMNKTGDLPTNPPTTVRAAGCSLIKN